MEIHQIKLIKIEAYFYKKSIKIIVQPRHFLGRQLQVTSLIFQFILLVGFTL